MHILICFKKIVEVVVGPVDLWISDFFKGNTAYPHVDRLCVTSGKLFTLSYILNCSFISFNCFCRFVSIEIILEIFSWA
jgi:hypothetical protein